MTKNLFYTLLLILSACTRINAQLILSEGFEGSVPPSGWTPLTFSSSESWTQGPASLSMSGTHCAMQDNSSTYNANAWLISPGYTLVPGVTYRLSYWYRVSISIYSERFKVTLGNAPAVAAQSTILHDYTAVNNATYVQGIDNFTVPVSGV